jgi:hypothetical protein
MTVLPELPPTRAHHTSNEIGERTALKSCVVTPPARYVDEGTGEASMFVTAVAGGVADNATKFVVFSPKPFVLLDVQYHADPCSASERTHPAVGISSASGAVAR